MPSQLSLRSYYCCCKSAEQGSAWEPNLPCHLLVTYEGRLQWAWVKLWKATIPSAQSEPGSFWAQHTWLPPSSASHHYCYLTLRPGRMIAQMSSLWGHHATTKAEIVSKAHPCLDYQTLTVQICLFKLHTDTVLLAVRIFFLSTGFWNFFCAVQTDHLTLYMDLNAFFFFFNHLLANRLTCYLELLWSILKNIYTEVFMKRCLDHAISTL